jgi:hypothetical protein
MPPHIDIAKRFGELIAKAKYGIAHGLLTLEAQATHHPADFKRIVEDMTAYAPGPIKEVIVMEDFILEDWPDKRSGDVAMVYVALVGDGFNEAVNVTLAQEGRDIRIRNLEWGRP